MAMRDVAKPVDHKLEALIAAHRKLSEENPSPWLELLPTEQLHAGTRDLPKLATSHPAQAWKISQEVDQQVFEELSLYQERINQLSATFKAALANGHKIIISGCGTSGRMGTLVANLFRQQFPIYSNRIVDINAGGDAAIVRASEGSEDNEALGVQQLKESGWTPDDIYIGVSANGGAGFINAQIKHVLSQNPVHKPILFTCNSIADCHKHLSGNPKTVFHSSYVSQRKDIEFLDICVGPMALAGSTKMQAATAQLSVLGFALMQTGQELRWGKKLELSFEKFTLALKKAVAELPSEDLAQLPAFMQRTIKAGNYLVWHANASDALNNIH